MADNNWFVDNAPDTTTADWFAMQDTASAAPASSTRAGLESRNPKTQSGREWLLDALPTLGGIGGGALAGILGTTTAPVSGPFGPAAASVVGAGLGGGIGEGLRQMGYRSQGWDVPDPLSMKALSLLGGEGVKQAGYQAGGELLGLGARLAAPGLSRMAANPGKKLMIEALRNEEGNLAAMPDVGKTMQEHRLTVGKNPITQRGGVAESRAAFRTSAGEEKAQRVAAGEAGKRVTVKELTEDIARQMGVEKDAPLSRIEVKKLYRKIRDYGNELLESRTHNIVNRTPRAKRPGVVLDQFGNAPAPPPVPRPPAVFTPEESDKLIRTGNLAASGKLAQGTSGYKNVAADPDFGATLAAANRRALTNPNTGIPGQELARRNTQALKGATMAIEGTQAKPMSVTRNITVPGMVAGAAAGFGPHAPIPDAAMAFLLSQLATNPALQSRLALAMSDPLGQLVIRQSPRAAGWLVFPPEGFPAPADSTR